MALVSEKIYSKWFKKSHWMYRQFSYLFDNPLWKLPVPPCFSLCPYFWLSMASFIFLRCLAVPVYLTVSFLVSLLACPFPYIRSAAAESICRLYRRTPDGCWLKESLRFHWEENGGHVRNVTFTPIIAVAAVYVINGYLSFYTGELLRVFALPVAETADMAITAAMCVVSLAGLYLALRLPEGRKGFFLLAAILLPPAFFTAAFFVGAVLIVGMVLWNVSSWFVLTAVPGIWFFTSGMATAAWMAIPSVARSAAGFVTGHDLPVWIPFVSGAATVILYMAFRRMWKRQAAHRRDSCPDPVEYEDVVAVMVSSLIGDGDLKDRLLASAEKALPGKDIHHRTAVVRKILTQAVTQEFGRLHEHVRHARWIGPDGFKSFKTGVEECGYKFMSYRSYTGPWIADDSEILPPIRERIHRMAKRGMLKTMREISATIPDQPSGTSAEIHPEGPWRATIVRLSAKSTAMASSAYRTVKKAAAPTAALASGAAAFLRQTCAYAKDVTKAMKEKACPVIWFK